MDERERQLDYLAKHALNAPSPAAPASGMRNQKLVQAIAQGFAPVVKQEP